jgi:hypothetical protein
LLQHTNSMNKTTADQVFLRENNLSSVLRFIQAQSPISRAQLAVLTGLNKSTVSSLMEDLLERRLVHETGINSAGTGRPATLLEINPLAGYIIGVELGVDFVSVGIADFLGNLIWRRKEDADPMQGQEIMIEQTLRLVKEAMTAGKKKGYCFLGLGLATPGTVDLKEGVLIFAPNLHWKNVPFQKIFSERTKLKVIVENDANAATIGEHLFGIARLTRDFIFVFAGGNWRRIVPGWKTIPGQERLRGRDRPLPHHGQSIPNGLSLRQPRLLGNVCQSVFDYPARTGTAGSQTQ